MGEKCLRWASLSAALVGGTLLWAAPASAAEGSTGKLVVTSNQWSAVLYAGRKAIRVSGNKEPVSVTAGTYRARYQISDTAEGAKHTTMLVGTVNKPFTIEAGKTTKLKIGSPLQATIKTSVQGRRATFNLVVRDAGNNTVTVYPPPLKGHQVVPKVNVVDSSGKTIYTATMAFG